MIPLAYNALLALAWAALLGFNSANLAIGAVLGYIVLNFALGSEPQFDRYGRKFRRGIAFCLYFLRELLVSSLRIAWDVLTPTHLARPGIIGVPLEASSDGEITILANLISLTPGTLSLQVSDDRSILYVHAMYLYDEQASVDGLKDLERRLLELMR